MGTEGCPNISRGKSRMGGRARQTKKKRKKKKRKGRKGKAENAGCLAKGVMKAAEDVDEQQQLGSAARRIQRQLANHSVWSAGVCRGGAVYGEYRV